MICLTGDVHQTPHPGSLDQPFSRSSEVECALEYARIAGAFGVDVTLLVTGKAVRCESRVMRQIAALDNVELGGHGYDARESFRPLYKVTRKLTGLSMGPKGFQRWDIGRTLRAFRDELGLGVASWRSHAYRYDRNTHPLLRAAGVRVVSDDVEPESLGPRMRGGLCHCPINVIPDHDHMVHGHYDDGVLKAQRLTLDRFPNDISYTPMDWVDEVKRQAAEISERGGLAVILAHPLCQEVGDRFEAFRELCSWLSGQETVHLGDVPQRNDVGNGA